MEKSPASDPNLFSEISDEVVKIFYVYLNSFRKSEACFARGSEHLRNAQKIVQLIIAISCPSQRMQSVHLHFNILR